LADTYTSSLRIVQQEIGANENTWGTINNAGLARLDQAVAGIESISVTAGNVTLTTANNADDQARNALLIFTGTPGTTRTVTCPNVEKLYWVINSCSDGSAITFTAGAGATITVPATCSALIYCDGATNVGNFTHRVAVGSGIHFPATQSASADANDLDDYEEGTFTPGLAFGGASVGITYAVQVGRYVKVGRLVSITSFHVTLTNNGSSSGAATATGLPFATSAATNAHSNFAFAGFGFASASGSLQAYVTPSGTSITLQEQGGVGISLTEANIDDNSEIMLNGVYEA
jgi:hypothetical protein